MKELLIVIGLAILFLLIAFAGLAIKSFFKKDAQLTTCSNSGGGCGCGAQQTCSTNAES